MAPPLTVLPLHGPALVINTCPFHVPTQSSLVFIPSIHAANIFFFSTCAGEAGMGFGRPSNVTTSPNGAIRGNAKLEFSVPAS